MYSKFCYYQTFEYNGLGEKPLNCYIFIVFQDWGVILHVLKKGVTCAELVPGEAGHTRLLRYINSWKLMYRVIFILTFTECPQSGHI